MPDPVGVQSPVDPEQLSVITVQDRAGGPARGLWVRARGAAEE